MDKIVFLPQGTGTALDTLNEMLANGWKVIQMQSGASQEDVCCFVWIQKEENAQ